MKVILKLVVILIGTYWHGCVKKAADKIAIGLKYPNFSIVVRLRYLDLSLSKNNDVRIKLNFS